MIVLPVILALSIPFVSAQANSTAVQIEAIEAHFTQAALVPELLATFDPSSILTINFDGMKPHYHHPSRNLKLV